MPAATPPPAAPAPPQPDPVELLARALAALGVTGDDPETERTPQRVADLYRSLFRGRDPASPPRPSLAPHSGEGPVLLADLPFHSMCAHHLLPFFGRAAVAYLPRGQVVGLSGIVDVVEHFAARPQLQERMAEQIADHLEAHLRPAGLLVHLHARHMCVEMRGSRRPVVVDYTAARGELVAGRERDALLRRLSD